MNFINGGPRSDALKFQGKEILRACLFLFFVAQYSIAPAGWREWILGTRGAPRRLSHEEHRGNATVLIISPTTLSSDIRERETGLLSSETEVRFGFAAHHGIRRCSVAARWLHRIHLSERGPLARINTFQCFVHRYQYDYRISPLERPFKNYKESETSGHKYETARANKHLPARRDW